MGFLDSLFGNNTASATQDATAQGISDIWGGVTGANQALSNTARNAANAYRTGASGAADALTGGYGQARADLANYGGQAQAQLGAGRDAAVGTILGGNANYAPYASTGQGANSMYANALGLNGAAGNDAATAAFRTSPGYQFQVDQGVDSVARKMAALGMAGSGNTMDAITRLSSGLADQEYGSWLSNLFGLSNQGLQAASGISGNNQAAGGIQYNAGATGAQLSQGLGGAMAGLGTGLGSALGGLQSSLGNALGGVQQSLGQQKAGNIMGGATGSASLGMQGATAADSAANANAGILSGLFGDALKLGSVGMINPKGLTFGMKG